MLDILAFNQSWASVYLQVCVAILVFGLGLQIALPPPEGALKVLGRRYLLRQGRI